MHRDEALLRVLQATASAMLNACTEELAKLEQEPAVSPAPPAVGTTMPDALLSVEEVAEWFNVKVDWLYDEIQARRLPFVRFGRTLRFRPDEMRKFLEEAKNAPAPNRPGTRKK